MEGAAIKAPAAAEVVRNPRRFNLDKGTSWRVFRRIASPEGKAITVPQEFRVSRCGLRSVMIAVPRRSVI
jgi:hypothetical protein